MVLAYLAAHHPGRFDRAVVLNPESPPQRDRQMSGLHGHIKQLVYSRPGLVVPLATHLSRRASARTVERLVLQVVGGSAADRATLADPDILAAYVRSTQQSAMQGGIGFLAIARSEPHDSVVALSDGSAITILCGAEDTMYAASDSLPYWQSLWPGSHAKVVADAGRMLLFQRPDLVAAALKPRKPASASMLRNIKRRKSLPFPVRQGYATSPGASSINHAEKRREDNENHQRTLPCVRQQRAC